MGVADHDAEIDAGPTGTEAGDDVARSDGAPGTGVGDADGIDIGHLRSALEFAVMMAQEGRKFRPPLRAPDGLHRYASANRITNRSLQKIRRLVEGDPTFRSRIAVGALPELVDPIGIVWLRRPDGWEDEIRCLIDAEESSRNEADLERQLKRAEKRRAAAEQASVRAQAEIVALRTRIDALDSELADAQRAAETAARTLDDMRSEVAEQRRATRHAEDRAASAAARADVAEQERDAARADHDQASAARDAALGRQVDHTTSTAELAAIAAAARTVVERLDGLVPRAERVERRPLPIPGGLVGTSVEAAEYLLSAGASVLVDGYNVGKLAWPELPLADERALTIDAAERLARRFGADITVVFDGADVVGANTGARRTVRVVYSDADELADDVLRSEVVRLPPARNVVVVTNDRKVIGDVRASGANTMASEQFLAVSR